MTLLCTYHHGLLHRGSFGIARESDDTLRFVTADGRTIPRRGYRVEDFVDDEIGGESHEAFDEPHVRDFAPIECSTNGTAGKYANPPRFIA